MYLRDIVDPELGTEAFLESIKQDFVLTNTDLSILTKLARHYIQETPGEHNYFIHAALFINKVSNTMIRLGVPKEAAEDFRLITPIYQEYYTIKDNKKNYDIMLIDKTANALKERFNILTKRYDDFGYKRHVMSELKATVSWTYDEFHILTSHITDGDMLASHCMSAGASEVYAPIKKELFKYG